MTFWPSNKIDANRKDYSIWYNFSFSTMVEEIIYMAERRLNVIEEKKMCLNELTNDEIGIHA